MLLIRSMKLAEWLKQTKIRRYVFAERIGVQPSVISDYCKGKYCPRPKVAEAIIRETGGAVTANDFLSISPDLQSSEPETAE
jgi:DNA-binding transcriptional regulator YdaS (Cro superfamily)